MGVGLKTKQTTHATTASTFISVKMSDVEGSPQPGSPEEEMDDLNTEETNGDHPEESEDADQEAGSRKRSLSTSEDKDDESPSKKVAKEEVSLAIICDTQAKNLEKIKQTETSIVFHLKVKVAEDLSLATIPSAVEDILSEDPETKCIVIVLPQDDLRQNSITQACKMNNCRGKEGMQHKLPLPITSLSTYVNTLRRTREELLETYPDTEFYWVTPGPVDFRQLNSKVKCPDCPVTPDFMWKNIISNYNKRLKVITDEISGDLTLSWFARSGWKQKGNKGKKNLKAQSSVYQRMLHGDLGPVREAGFIEKGEELTQKGAQEMWMMIRKKIHWYRSKAKKGNEEDDPSAATEEDQQNGEEVNGKAEENAQTENDVNESQKKKTNTIKTTVIGDEWLQMISEVERWHPDNKARMNIKIFPDLTLESVIERVDEVLTEKTDTENLVLSIFQNDVSSGLSEYIQNENLPCAFSIVDYLLEKASEIKKYIKNTYPKIKVMWVAPGPVGFYSEEDKKEEKSKEEKKEEKETDEDKANEEDKADDEDKADEDKTDEDKDEEKSKTEVKDKKMETEEEEKEEDPETKQLRRACSRCNTIAMVLNKRLHNRFKNHVVSWFDIFSSNRSGNVLSTDQKLEGQILEGKIVTHGYLEEDYINLSEM